MVTVYSLLVSIYLIIHGIMLLLLAIGAPAEGTLAVGSYVYDERRLSLLWKITIRLQKEISFVCNDAS
jgi:hypothetical protein